MMTTLDTNKEKVEAKEFPFSKKLDKYLEYSKHEGIMAYVPKLTSLAVSDTYKDFVTDFALDLAVEYDCKTPSERALAQLAAIAYTKVFDYSDQFKGVKSLKTTSHELNGYYSLLGKEIDRSNRHFLSYLMALRQTKEPKLKINVTAQTAFVAENQQVNINKDEKI